MAMIVGGTVYLGLACNWLTAALTLATSLRVPRLLYAAEDGFADLHVHGRDSPGRCLRVLGWAAVRGRLDWDALILFAIVFFWQFPHFHAIALLYREDYERAGIRMLPVVERSRKTTAEAIVFYSLACWLRPWLRRSSA